MIPLHIVARVPGQIAIPGGTIALDGLLAWVVTQREGRPPPLNSSDCTPVEIPIAKEPGGRFHLCSFGVYRMTDYDVRYVNRRSPIEQYQDFGMRGRVQITAGAEKSYRLPLEVGHLRGERVEWWCVGNEPAVRHLLADVLYLGKKRAVGLGKVASWTIEPCETWDGFPVARDGAPLRALPLDWPGLTDPAQAYSAITFPYWSHEREELCAVPARHH